MDIIQRDIASPQPDITLRIKTLRSALTTINHWKLRGVIPCLSTIP